MLTGALAHSEQFGSRPSTGYVAKVVHMLRNPGETASD
jgi:hypothetical protein